MKVGKNPTFREDFCKVGKHKVGKIQPLGRKITAGLGRKNPTLGRKGKNPTFREENKSHL